MKNLDLNDEDEVDIDRLLDSGVSKDDNANLDNSAVRSSIESGI